MNSKYLTLRHHQGFAVLSLSMILTGIVIFASVSYARIQQKRANRIIIDLAYQQAKLDAETSLDIFHMTLQSSPKTVAQILSKPYDGRLRGEHKMPALKGLFDTVNIPGQLFAYPFADNMIEIGILVQAQDAGLQIRRLRRLGVTPITGSAAEKYELRWLPYSDIDF